MDYIKQHGEINGDTIEALVSGDDKVLRSDNGIDFIEFAKQRFIDRYKSGKIGVSSRENGISYINQFAKFLKQEHRGSHGDDDAIGSLCCQFPITADYDGVGMKGSKFAFYL